MSPHGANAGQVPPSGGDLLFVYGSLRRGSSHHHILEGLHALFAGPGTVEGQLFDLGSFPGAKPWPSDASAAAAGASALASDVSSRVTGELYRLRRPERDLAVLDRYEGFRPDFPAASFFRRGLARVRTRDGSFMEAWVYWLNRGASPRRVLTSGDYTRRKIAASESP